MEDGKVKAASDAAAFDRSRVLTAFSPDLERWVGWTGWFSDRADEESFRSRGGVLRRVCDYSYPFYADGDVAYRYFHPLRPPMERRIRAYGSVVELREAFLSRADAMAHPLCEPAVWVRHKASGMTARVTGYDDAGGRVLFGGSLRTLEKLARSYEFLDGSPCGVLEADDGE